MQKHKNHPWSISGNNFSKIINIVHLRWHMQKPNHQIRSGSRTNPSRSRAGRKPSGRIRGQEIWNQASPDTERTQTNPGSRGGGGRWIPHNTPRITQKYRARNTCIFPPQRFDLIHSQITNLTNPREPRTKKNPEARKNPPYETKITRAARPRRGGRRRE